MKMKILLLTLCVVAVSTVPLPKDNNDGVEMAVNEVPDGAALEARGIVDVKLKEHATVAVVSTDMLHPHTAVGTAETQAATAVSSARNKASVDDKDNAVMTPKLHPMPEVINPKPAVELPYRLPVAAAYVDGQVPNDGQVKVQYNGPEEIGMMSTLQEWYKVLVKYFNSGSSPAAAEAPVAPIVHQHRH